ncbi:hypothetical protein HY383_02370 [Candidatus Daviesbacteria bacterium]|nr:hypothetical protein [Candidatus Daviesbacteria bacterium]
MAINQIELGSAAIAHMITMASGEAIGVAAALTHEKRPLSAEERLRLLGFTLPETIEQGHNGLKGHLQIAGKLMQRNGNVKGYWHTCWLNEAVDINQKAIIPIRNLIIDGHFDSNPQAGINAMLALNPELIGRARAIAMGIHKKLLPKPLLENISQIVPNTQRLLDLGIENYEQLLVLDQTLRLPPNYPIDIYHGYNGDPILLIAKKHLPENMKQAA